MEAMVLDEIFKAYDIRGKVPNELTPLVAERVGWAFGCWLPAAGTVAVGRDMRKDSGELAKAFIKGVAASGRSVWDLGLITTDMIYFAVGRFQLAGGAVITASHNPKDYNGIKLTREEARPVGATSGLGAIKRAVTKATKVPTPTTKGKVVKKDVRAEWIEHVLSFVEADTLRPYKIAVDAGNGMVAHVVPLLEPKVPFEITELDFRLDGTFPLHEANPAQPENLEHVAETIKRDQLDFGIAFDGDGDRAFFVDEHGDRVSGSVMQAILAEHFLQEHPGAPILFDVRTSKTVLDVIQKHEGQPVRTRVGHSFVKAKMREIDAPYAGEASGHFYFRDNFYADSGLIAAMLVIDILSRSGLTMAELADEYRRYYQSGELNFRVPDGEQVIDALAAEFKDGEQDSLDGLTVRYADWWFNVRPSHTEPLLRLNVEATTEEGLQTALDRITGLIKKLDHSQK